MDSLAWLQHYAMMSVRCGFKAVANVADNTDNRLDMLQRAVYNADMADDYAKYP